MAANGGDQGYDLLANFVPRVIDAHDPKDYPRMQEHLPEYLAFVDAFDYRNRMRLAGVDAALFSLSNGYMAAIGMLSRAEDKNRFFQEVSGPHCRQVAHILRAGIVAEYGVDLAKLTSWDMFLLGQIDEKPL